MPANDPHAANRERMVRRHIVGRGISDPRVLAAFKKVPREQFVPAGKTAESYQDHPVGIGCGQTVSQPYIVALMLAELALQGPERVLEIGTGSGYQTALLAELCHTVYSIERIPGLAESARARLAAMGYDNVRYRILEEQIAEGGRMILPVGGHGSQNLIRLTRRTGKIERRSVCGCVFVKLIGQEAWNEDD